MALPETVHEISLQSKHSIVWIDAAGNRQTVKANATGAGFTVETQITAPTFDDGSAKKRVVESKTTDGQFGTNFHGVSAIFKNTG